ncbi:MAG: PilZ domain-containing protein [Rehaibacterium terrae]|uniref:PilZ domain-containing protein n=1 Tax=Rehaibacterium terrae TaxID=1341696 RepID=UPI0039199591
MTAEAAERELFDDALTCREALPAEFVPDALDAASRERAAERAEGLLRAIALVEDGHGEEGDERGANEPVLQRIEAKLNLLFELVGLVVRREVAPLPVVELRWSRRGVELAGASPVAPGQAGLLRLQPVSWLPQAIELPVEVIAVDRREPAPRLWLRFSPLPEALESALERHLFRLHRRAIAGARRQR